MKKDKIKLIIFDAAGVTWDGGYPTTCRYLSKRYNIPYKKVLDIMQNKWFLKACTGSMSSIEAFQKGADELGILLSGKKIESLHLSFHKPRKSVLNFSKYLRKSGYKTILLSNNFSAYINKFRKDFNLDEYFDDIVNSQDLGFSKSDRRMFLHVLKKYKVKVAEALIFDDLEQNLEMPRKMGITTILFKNAAQIKRDVLKFLNINEK